MVFEFAALGTVLLNQVARELDVSLMGVYLARHRVAKLFGAEVNAAAGDGVVLVNAS